MKRPLLLKKIALKYSPRVRMPCLFYRDAFETRHRSLYPPGSSTQVAVIGNYLARAMVPGARELLGKKPACVRRIVIPG